MLDSITKPQGRRTLGAAAAAGSAVIAAAALFGGRPATAQQSTLLQVLERSRDLSRFAAWVKQAGLENELAAPGNVALFVPHDEAVERLTAAQLQRIEANRDTLRRAVHAHLAEWPNQLLAGGSSGESEGGSGATIRSRAGTTIIIANGARSFPRVNEFRVYVANMRASNGIAHCIDGVLGL